MNKWMYKSIGNRRKIKIPSDDASDSMTSFSLDWNHDIYQYLYISIYTHVSSCEPCKYTILYVRFWTCMHHLFKSRELKGKLQSGTGEVLTPTSWLLFLFTPCSIKAHAVSSTISLIYKEKNHTITAAAQRYLWCDSGVFLNKVQ